MNAIAQTAADLLAILANNWGKLAIVAMIATPIVCVLSNVAELVNN
tara:strand:+ start:39210 stop:39347 length:138 start_codon:yes stop_codon:yes gene_type:complete